MLKAPAPNPRDTSISGPARWLAAGVLFAASLFGATRAWTTRRAAVPGDGAERASLAAGAPASGIAAGKLDLNRATAAELELLPRIGPALAKRIIDDRAARGPFRSVDDLARVRGIGGRTVEQLRPYVAVRAAP